MSAARTYGFKCVRDIVVYAHAMQCVFDGLPWGDQNGVERQQQQTRVVYVNDAEAHFRLRR